MSLCALLMTDDMNAVADEDETDTEESGWFADFCVCFFWLTYCVNCHAVLPSLFVAQAAMIVRY